MHTFVVSSMFAGVAALGCGTYTTYQTAEPLDAGRWQVALASTAGRFSDVPSRAATPTMISEFAVRRGLGGDTDVGLKLFTFGAELGVRYRFFEGQWQWAALGAVSWARTEERFGTTDASQGQLRLGLAGTRRISSRSAYTLGPALTGSTIAFAGGGNAYGLLVGAFANVQRSLGDSRRWHLIPELSLHATAAGDVPVQGFVALLGVALARDL
jgi:hypothetical protein